MHVHCTQSPLNKSVLYTSRLSIWYSKQKKNVILNFSTFSNSEVAVLKPLSNLGAFNSSLDLEAGLFRVLLKLIFNVLLNNVTDRCMAENTPTFNPSSKFKGATAPQCFFSGTPCRYGPFSKFCQASTDK